MSLKGVITGDIVNSRKIMIGHRDLLKKSLEDLNTELSSVTPIRLELYRGDSFQVFVENAMKTARIAIMIRAWLKKQTPVGNPPWDARLSIGIGTVEYQAQQIIVSDGTAYQRSGFGLDHIGKRRLAVSTGAENVDYELAVSTMLLDDVITGWTVRQASIMYDYLKEQVSQKKLAEYLSQSQQNLSKILIAAKADSIDAYVNRYELLIQQL